MENNDRFNFITELIKNQRKSIEEANKVYKVLSSGLKDIVKISDSYWKSENQFDGAARIKNYRSQLAQFLTRNSSADEENFIKSELEGNAVTLKNASKHNVIQEQVIYHIKKYNNFLEDRLYDIKLEKSHTTDDKIGDKPLPFLTNRTETVALILLLMDCGIIVPMSDYRLGAFLERNVLYDSDQPMISIAKEISKYCSGRGN